MELVDRYLQSVRFWLPQKQKADIIAELSEDLHSQIEERESELGRHLTDDDLAVLLKQRGRPVLVANRYLPQEHLIGPVLFPVYRFVLKIAVLCYLVPWLGVYIGLRIFFPDVLPGHAGQSWIDSMGSLWNSFQSTAIFTLGIITIIFAVLERVQAKSHFLERWDPRKLPPVRQPNLIPRSASSVELAVNLVIAGFWAANMASPFLLNLPSVRISLSPVWTYFFWGFLLLMLLNAVLAGINLVRPYWTASRATLRLISNLIGAGLFASLLRANILAGIVAVNIPPEKALAITNAVNLWMGRMMPVAIVIALVVAAIDAYRIVRAKAEPAAADAPGSSRLFSRQHS